MCTAWRMWEDPNKKRPPAGIKLLVAYRNSWGKIRRTVAEYIAPRTVLAEDYLDWEYDNDALLDVDGNGQEWVKEGWFESPEESDGYRISEPIIAWITLPELPCDWRRS